MAESKSQSKNFQPAGARRRVSRGAGSSRSFGPQEAQPSEAEGADVGNRDSSLVLGTSVADRLESVTNARSCVTASLAELVAATMGNQQRP